MESRQSPCFHRCFDDLGGAYAMGCIGGAAWHAIKGWRNAPKKHGTVHAVQAVALRAPVLGGNFAVWGGLFSVFDCGMVRIRQREDPINAITAGALTGGILAIRGGWKAAGLNAIIGGALLGLIEGVGFIIGRMSQGSSAPPPAPGTTLGNPADAANSGMAMGSRHMPLATMQPRQLLSPALEDPAAEMGWGMEDEDMGSAAERLAANQATSDAANRSLSPLSSSFLASGSKAPPPIYTATPEFSSDDFSFNDTGDFDEE